MVQKYVINITLCQGVNPFDGSQGKVGLFAGNPLNLCLQFITPTLDQPLSLGQQQDH